jgi:hypothetical protein
MGIVREMDLTCSIFCLGDLRRFTISESDVYAFDLERGFIEVKGRHYEGVYPIPCMLYVDKSRDWQRCWEIEIDRIETVEDTSHYWDETEEDGTVMSICLTPTERQIIWFRVVEVTRTNTDS